MDIAVAVVTDPQTGVREFDFVRDGPDLLAEFGLQTAVELSLFCDRAALRDDRVPGDAQDARGWWADRYFANGNPGANDRLGSRLWLLEGLPATAATARMAIAYAKEALGWLIADRIAESLDIEARWVKRDVLALFVTLAQRNPRSGVSTGFTYEFIWSPTVWLKGDTSGTYADVPQFVGTENSHILGTEDGEALGLE